jgi:hypothetical protein
MLKVLARDEDDGDRAEVKAERRSNGTWCVAGGRSREERGVKGNCPVLVYSRDRLTWTSLSESPKPSNALIVETEPPQAQQF